MAAPTAAGYLLGICLLAFVLTTHAINQLSSDHILNFLLVGDWGRKGTYNQSAIATQMGIVAEKVNAQFVISTGDNFYEDGLTGVSDPQFKDSFTDIYTADSLQIPWFACLGNHDYRGDVLAQLSPLLKARDPRWNCQRSFTLSYNLTSQSEEDSEGGVEIFVIDTTPFVKKYWKIPNKHDYDWRGVQPRRKYMRNQVRELERSLKASNAAWKIVVGHHPIRSVGHHGDTAELQKTILPVLEANNVHVYINGHDHCLEHITSNESGVKYLTSGGGSKAWRGINEEANMEGLQMYYDGQGFLWVQSSVDKLSATFYDINGSPVHRLDISKTDSHMPSGERAYTVTRPKNR